MCARYTMVSDPAAWAGLFQVDPSGLDLQPRYNVAPTQPVPVVGLGATGQRSVQLLMWGLTPPWSKGAPIVNARSETVFDKPSFRQAARARRALMVADGFYEWRDTPTGKQASLFRRPDGAPFAFAAIWEKTQEPDGRARFGVALLTTRANAVVAPTHDRMPVILSEPAQHAAWLDPATPQEALQALLVPAPESLLCARTVGRRVNSSRVEGPECWEP